MIKADNISVAWDQQKKVWRVRIQAGEEVVKRPASGQKLSHDTGDEILRSAAIETAQADGYEADPAVISIVR